jgi:hypothetical protein
MLKYAMVSYDWKEGGCEEEWICALKKFGLFATKDPIAEGSDQYSYFVTGKELTDEELAEIVRDHYEESEIAQWGEDYWKYLTPAFRAELEAEETANHLGEGI